MFEKIISSYEYINLLADIGTLFIIEKGFSDDIFPLKGHGHVHIRLNFVSTEDERKLIEAMVSICHILEVFLRSLSWHPLCT